MRIAGQGGIPIGFGQLKMVIMRCFPFRMIGAISMIIDYNRSDLEETVSLIMDERNRVRAEVF